MGGEANQFLSSVHKFQAFVGSLAFMCRKGQQRMAQFFFLLSFPLFIFSSPSCSPLHDIVDAFKAIIQLRRGTEGPKRNFRRSMASPLPFDARWRQQCGIVACKPSAEMRKRMVKWFECRGRRDTLFAEAIRSYRCAINRKEI